jgi:hypothetical protein
VVGFVERAIFHNEESGFYVLCVKARGQHDAITS